MRELTKDQAGIMTYLSQYLEKDDLNGFYCHLIDSPYGLSAEDAYAISEFLDDNGIYLEDYGNYIPPNYLYMPNRWRNHKTVTIPPQITDIYSDAWNFDSFYSEDMTDVVAIQCPGIVEVYDSVFSGMKLRYIRFSDKLEYVDERAFTGTEYLERVYIPKGVDNNVKEQLETALSYSARIRKVQLKEE